MIIVYRMLRYTLLFTVLIYPYANACPMKCVKCKAEGDYSRAFLNPGYRGNIDCIDDQNTKHLLRQNCYGLCQTTISIDYVITDENFVVTRYSLVSTHIVAERSCSINVKETKKCNWKVSKDSIMNVNCVSFCTKDDCNSETIFNQLILNKLERYVPFCDDCNIVYTKRKNQMEFDITENTCINSRKLFKICFGKCYFIASLTKKTTVEVSKGCANDVNAYDLNKDTSFVYTIGLWIHSVCHALPYHPCNIGYSTKPPLKFETVESLQLSIDLLNNQSYRQCLSCNSTRLEMDPQSNCELGIQSSMLNVVECNTQCSLYFKKDVNTVFVERGCTSHDEMETNLPDVINGVYYCNDCRSTCTPRDDFSCNIEIFATLDSKDISDEGKIDRNIKYRNQVMLTHRIASGSSRHNRSIKFMKDVKNEFSSLIGNPSLQGMNQVTASNINNEKKMFFDENLYESANSKKVYSTSKFSNNRIGISSFDMPSFNMRPKLLRCTSECNSDGIPVDSMEHQPEEYDTDRRSQKSDVDEITDTNKDIIRDSIIYEEIKERPGYSSVGSKDSTDKQKAIDFYERNRRMQIIREKGDDKLKKLWDERENIQVELDIVKEEFSNIDGMADNIKEELMKKEFRLKDKMRHCIFDISQTKAETESKIDVFLEDIVFTANLFNDPTKLSEQLAIKAKLIQERDNQISVTNKKISEIEDKIASTSKKMENEQNLPLKTKYAEQNKKSKDKLDSITSELEKKTNNMNQNIEKIENQIKILESTASSAIERSEKLLIGKKIPKLAKYKKKLAKAKFALIKEKAPKNKLQRLLKKGTMSSIISLESYVAYYTIMVQKLETDITELELAAKVAKFNGGIGIPLNAEDKKKKEIELRESVDDLFKQRDDIMKLFDSYMKTQEINSNEVNIILRNQFTEKRLKRMKKLTIRKIIKLTKKVGEKNPVEGARDYFSTRELKLNEQLAFEKNKLEEIERDLIMNSERKKLDLIHNSKGNFYGLEHHNMMDEIENKFDKWHNTEMVFVKEMTATKNEINKIQEEYQIEEDKGKDASKRALKKKTEKLDILNKKLLKVKEEQRTSVKENAQKYLKIRKRGQKPGIWNGRSKPGLKKIRNIFGFRKWKRSKVFALRLLASAVLAGSVVTSTYFAMDYAMQPKEGVYDNYYGNYSDYIANFTNNQEQTTEEVTHESFEVVTTESKVFDTSTPYTVEKSTDSNKQNEYETVIPKDLPKPADSGSINVDEKERDNLKEIVTVITVIVILCIALFFVYKAYTKKSDSSANNSIGEMTMDESDYRPRNSRDIRFNDGSMRDPRFNQMPPANAPDYIKQKIIRDHMANMNTQALQNNYAAPNFAPGFKNAPPFPENPMNNPMINPPIVKPGANKQTADKNAANVITANKDPAGVQGKKPEVQEQDDISGITLDNDISITSDNIVLESTH